MSDYVSVNIPPVLRMEADLFVKGGYFTDRSEFIRAAMREYIEKLSSKRIEIAVHLYQDEEVSLARAAQIAKTSISKMKTTLHHRGVEVRVGPEDEDEAKKEYETAREIV